jgi:hypothetical protein
MPSLSECRPKAHEVLPDERLVRGDPVPDDVHHLRLPDSWCSEHITPRDMHALSEKEAGSRVALCNPAAGKGMK